MTPLSPLVFLSSARALVGAHPDHDVLAKRSAWADDPIHSVRGSAAFVNHVGMHSQGGVVWPFALDADCNEMARIARHFGVLRSQCLQPGMIGLKWDQERGRFRRAGIVIQAERVGLDRSGLIFKSIVFEGKATVTPVGHGRFTTRVVWSRVASEWFIPSDGDRFIDWVALDRRSIAELWSHRRVA